MRVTRRRGVVRVGLDEVEIGLLRSLFADLEDALDQLADDDPVRERLFPNGYRDDPQAAAEYRDLTESTLLSERKGRLRRTTSELPDSAGEVSMDAERSQRWLIVLNDLRLALGTRIGITADVVPEDLVGDATTDDSGGFDDSGSDDSGEWADRDPDARPAPDRAARAVYVWLTALQDRLVEAVID